MADIVGENGVIEIQTRQFNKLLKKLEAFLDYCDVTVVYPIPAVKYVRWIDTETGELSEKHKSPRKYTIYEVMPELYKIKYTLFAHTFHSFKICEYIKRYLCIFTRYLCIKGKVFRSELLWQVLREEHIKVGRAVDMYFINKTFWYSVMT